ncbi:hypothetical protein DFH09DRAFT_1319834 [Mycena vulgaris]|nr:hypothetical protein DFH09DRAFT_1319834 [Mycena vulgaris]
MFWLSQASTAQVQTLAAFYPNDITKGSPFDTGAFNALSPQFKRISAVPGDSSFPGNQNTEIKLCMMSKRLKDFPFLGSFHASDKLNIYYDGELRLPD